MHHQCGQTNLHDGLVRGVEARFWTDAGYRHGCCAALPRSDVQSHCHPPDGPLAVRSSTSFPNSLASPITKIFGSMAILATKRSFDLYFDRNEELVITTGLTSRPNRSRTALQACTTAAKET